MTLHPPAPRRMLLPMSTGVHILPGTDFQITARPQCAFSPDRLVIKHASRWRVHEIRVDGQPILGRLRGALFASEAETSPIRDVSSSSPLRMRPGSDMVVQASYRGDRDAGESFEAALFGQESTTFGPRVENPDLDVDDFGEATVRSKVHVLPNTSIQLHMTCQDLLSGDARTVYPARISLEDAADWVVNDLKLYERSVFTQSGDVPAELLSSRLWQIGALEPGGRLTIVATYIGERGDGAPLVCRVGFRTQPSPSSTPFSRFLPMSSGVQILPNTSAQLTSRCQISHVPAGQGFQARRIVVRDAADWVVNDLGIGRVHQFIQGGDVPGVCFSATGVDQVVALDPAPAEIDVQMTVTYVGPHASGASFVCGMVGDVVDLEGPLAQPSVLRKNRP